MLEQINYDDPLHILMAAESDEDIDGEADYSSGACPTGMTWDNDRDDMLGASPAELAFAMLAG
jgi:hypothetical protein